jgi:hypothetical protein
MRARPFPSGRPSWFPVLSQDRPPARTWVPGGWLPALALLGALAVSQAQGLAQRETDGPNALRPPTEAAIARETAQAAPLRLGDYFLFGGPRAEGTPANGMRLSTGLFGPLHPFTLFDAPLADPAPQPYLGLGYSRAWQRSGLSLSADVGVTSPASNGAARVRGVLGGSQNLDDAVRDLRWSPVMAVNVNYAF